LLHFLFSSSWYFNTGEGFPALWDLLALHTGHALPRGTGGCQSASAGGRCLAWVCRTFTKTVCYFLPVAELLMLSGGHLITSCTANLGPLWAAEAIKCFPTAYLTWSAPEEQHTLGQLLTVQQAATASGCTFQFPGGS